MARTIDELIQDLDVLRGDIRETREYLWNHKRQEARLTDAERESGLAQAAVEVEALMDRHVALRAEVERAERARPVIEREPESPVEPEPEEPTEPTEPEPPAGGERGA